MKLSHVETSAVAMSIAGVHEQQAKENSAGAKGPQKTHGHSEKKKPVLSMLLFGAISLVGYVALIANQQLVTDTFTKGGWYAIFPVGAALIFSFVHGAFSSDLLSVLGLEAKK